MIEYLSLKRITAMHADEIGEAVARVVESGRYLQGECVERFEGEFAGYVGARHCVTMGNGLDALTLMLRAYKELGRLKDGDGVIVPANTFIATILAITENALRPILVEPRIDTFQLDDALIEQSITERTRAVMLVHLYGYDAFTPKIAELCGKYGLILLQDCAQAHGLPIHVGGGCAAFSFYPGKNIGALADAGAAVTNDGELAAVMRAMANYGSSKRHTFRYKGRNSRMDELNAAVLSVKLKYLDDDNRRRQEIADYYIGNICGLTLPPRTGVHHVFPVLFSDRDLLRAKLCEGGVETAVHYPVPPHKQPCFREWNAISLPITERIHREELSLPLNQAMTDAEVERVAELCGKLQMPHDGRRDVNLAD